MANATAITVHNLVANASNLNPTADVLDTGTTPVTLYAPVAGKSERFILRVLNTAVVGLGVTVLPGDQPPAHRAAMGGLAMATIAGNAVVYFGPFESGRFIQSDGTIGFTFTPASGTIAASVHGLLLPKAT